VTDDTGQLVKTLRTGVSAAGRRVTLTRECGKYFGARPYYAVVRYKTDGRPQDSRYTPLEPNAEAFYQCFLRDETDPERLKAARDAA
jgi:hypothetical protein